MIPNPIIEIAISSDFVLKVHMYGVMIAVGILAAFAVLFFYGRKMKVDLSFLDFIYYTAIFAIALGFLSAALFQATYDFIENPSAGFNIDGGITFIGGLIGGTITFLLIYFISRKKLKGRLVNVLSLIPCSILVGHAFGRIGCFCAGCCYGRPTDSFLGVRFPGHIQDVHPTQLYEAFFLFALFAVCSYLLLKKGFKHNMSVYLVAYGIFRFLIEFVRDDERGQLLGFISPSQFWSILMIGLGVGVYFLVDKLTAPEALSTEEE